VLLEGHDDSSSVFEQDRWYLRPRVRSGSAHVEAYRRSCFVEILEHRKRATDTICGSTERGLDFSRAGTPRRYARGSTLSRSFRVAAIERAIANHDVALLPRE
jgi:hypothetical protein